MNRPLHEDRPRCRSPFPVLLALLGMKIMAEAWYRTLAGGGARPDVIAPMHERKYDVRPMMAEYMRWRKEG